MTSQDTIRIWAHGQCGPRGYGGWAWVRSAADGVAGAAGGERLATNARMELAAVVEALGQLPEKQGQTPIVIHTNSRIVAATAMANLPIWRTGQAGEPLEEWDLWSKIAVMAAQRPISFTHLAVGGKDPADFAAAWSDLACDKVKAVGPFSAAIPKPNLAKCPGLTAG